MTLYNQNEEYQSKAIRLEREIKDKNRLLAVMGKVFYKLYAVFRDAVDALIHFAKAKNASNYGTIDYRQYLFSHEREAVEKGIKTFTFDDNPEDICDLMVETAKVEGKLTEHEVDRAERDSPDYFFDNGNVVRRGRGR